MNFKEVRLIRILAWILFYLVVLFVLIFALVVPVVKSYKEANRRYVETKTAYLAAKNEHDTIFDRLKALKAKNRKVLHAFENPWNEKRFLETARRYFTAVSLRPVEVNATERHYKIYEINARAKMESPQNFYKFLEALPSIPHVIQADFPIAFRSDGKSEIEGVFRIRVYQEADERAESNGSKPSVSKR
ncbi:hypothetical protein [Hydrogenimonas sp.]